MSTIAAACGAIVALTGLVMWILNRRNHATPEQQIDDRCAEMDSLHRDITTARARGDDARAESLLRRLCELQNPRSDSPGHSPGNPGERDSNTPASGNSSNPP